MLVSCGGELKFYYGPNGEEEFSVSRRRRSLVTEAEAHEEEVNGGFVADPSASFSSFSLGTGVQGATSGSLRGGAKGSKTIT